MTAWMAVEIAREDPRSLPRRRALGPKYREQHRPRFKILTNQTRRERDYIATVIRENKKGMLKWSETGAVCVRQKSDCKTMQIKISFHPRLLPGMTKALNSGNLLPGIHNRIKFPEAVFFIKIDLGPHGSFSHFKPKPSQFPITASPTPQNTPHHF